jgi:hypothetical protein
MPARRSTWSLDPTSEPLTVSVTASVTVAAAPAEIDTVPVGAVWSPKTVAAVAAVAGPVFPATSDAPFEAKVRITVPVAHEATETV